MKKVLITILVILLLGNLLGMSGIIAGDLVTNSNRTLAQQSPYIVKTIPYDGTINVGLNEDIIIGFSEPMNTATITYSCSPLPSGGFSASWGSDIKNVTFSHLSAFEKYTIYVFEVTSGQDLDGNPLIADVIPNPFNFKTVGDDPLIIETIPAHDATGVALDSDIVVKFNNPMNTSTITYQCTPSVAGGFTAQWNVDNNAVTFSQASGFVKNTQYTFAITAGKDEKGMDLIPSPIPNPWNFTTYSKGPSINHTTPGQNTTHVALNADIIVKFSEPMNTSTVLFAISPDPGGWSASWNALNDEVTFTHSNPFVKNTYHTFQITAGKDLHGLELEPSDLNPWSFTTVGGGYDDPFIIETTPVNGAVNVSLAAEIVIEFSSPMNSTTVQYSITPTVGGFTANWNLDNTEVTYQHTINFVKKTLHTFTITAAKDEEGFDLNDGWVPNPFAFTTIGDNPIIEGTTPADGTTGVALNADIIVEFSKPMNTGTVVFTSDPVPAAGFTASWNTDGDIVTFLHDADFIEDYVYTVRVASGKDLDGYDLVAGVIPNPFVFRTIGGEPVIFSTTPAEGEIGVKLNQDIVIEFSESMHTETVHYAITSNAGDPGGWTVIWSNNGQTLTLDHNDFAAKTKYRFEITAGHDLTANALIPGPVPNPFEFTTDYVNGLEYLTSTLLTPAEGASVNTLQPTFAWDATNDSVEYHVFLGTDSLKVARLDASTLSIVTSDTYYTPTNALEPETVYYWIVIPSDGIDQGTCKSDVWSFNTPSKHVPELTSTLLSPTDGSVVDTHKPTLSWKGSDNAVKYYVYLSSDKVKVAIHDGSVLVATVETNLYTPPNNLARNTTYYWTVIPSDGTYYGSCNVWNFTSPLDEKPTEKEEKAETDLTMWMALIVIIVIIIIILIVLIIVVFLIFKRKKTPPPPSEEIKESWNREFR